VNLPQLAVKNVWRNKLRTILTLLGVCVTILAFVLIRTVGDAWEIGVENAAKDRLATRHKVSFIMQLPMRYAADVAQVPGIKGVTWMNWVGHKNPNFENEFFGLMAVDAATLFDVYDELIVPDDQKQSFKENRRGLIVGDVIAKKFGWKVGDKVTLVGTIYPGDWQYEVSGIYQAARKSIDRSSIFMHWTYLNETVQLAEQKDKVGWIVTRIDDPSRGPAIASAIDAMFDSRDVQTLTQSERDLQNSFLGMMSAVLQALKIVSGVILLIMALILGNTIAMGVRERTTEYGVLRALGFAPGHIGAFVLGEGITLGVFGGALGLLVSYPIVEKGMGRFLEENMGAWFPWFRIQPGTATAAMVMAVILAVAASAIPAFRASRLRTIDALRRVG
jgi:putative ABC transport system permease protein